MKKKLENCIGCRPNPCVCKQYDLPSMNTGMHLGSNNPIVYTSNSSLLEKGTGPLWNNYSHEEEIERMRDILRTTDLKETDQELFIARVVFKFTFKQLSKIYGLKDPSSSFYRYKRIKQYLKEVL